MWSAMSDGAEMFDQDWNKFRQWAASADDVTLGAMLQKSGTTLGNLRAGDARKFILGLDPNTQKQVANGLFSAFASVPGVSKKTAARMAGSGLAKGFGRLVPGLSVAGNVMDVADIVTGDESFGNKAMDTTAMVVGGAIGGILGGGPLGASMGASTGKMLSDGTQWLFGDKKSPEQRRMEEALAALQQRGLV